MKNQVSLVIIILVSLIFFGCVGNNRSNNTSSKPESELYDFSSSDGVRKFLTDNRWNQWDGVMEFNQDGTCRFFKRNKRTEQLEYNIYGTFQVRNSRFDDDGSQYWYVKISWNESGVINDFYVINRSHLVENQGRVYFDSYGPVLESWRFKGGLVRDMYKVYPY